MTPARITTPEAWSRWGWLVDAVAERHGVLADSLLGRGHTIELTRARRDLMTCLWGSGCAFAEVGRLLGMHHTSIMYAVRKELR